MFINTCINWLTHVKRKISKETIPQGNIFTIIPRVYVGFEKEDLISNKREWNNCFIKNAQKNCNIWAPQLFSLTRIGYDICGQWYISSYNPPINFHARLLDKIHHVVQNRTMGISQYTPSDLISVVRFFIAVQNKRKIFKVTFSSLMF